MGCLQVCCCFEGSLSGQDLSWEWQDLSGSVTGVPGWLREKQLQMCCRCCLSFVRTLSWGEAAELGMPGQAGWVVEVPTPLLLLLVKPMGCAHNPTHQEWMKAVYQSLSLWLQQIPCSASLGSCYGFCCCGQKSTAAAEAESARKTVLISTNVAYSKDGARLRWDI